MRVGKEFEDVAKNESGQCGDACGSVVSVI